MDDLTRASECVVTKPPACDRRANESGSHEEAFVAAGGATVQKNATFRPLRYPKNAPTPNRLAGGGPPRPLVPVPETGVP